MVYTTHLSRTCQSTKAITFQAVRKVINVNIVLCSIHSKLELLDRYLRSCRFITVVRAHLKVPAKNPPALLFLSRGKTADFFSFSSFPLQRKSKAGEFLAGTFKSARTTVIKRQDRKSANLKSLVHI